VIWYPVRESRAYLSSDPIDGLHFFQEKVAFLLVLQQRCSLYSIYQLPVYTASTLTEKSITTTKSESENDYHGDVQNKQFNIHLIIAMHYIFSRISRRKYGTMFTMLNKLISISKTAQYNNGLVTPSIM